MKADRGYPKCIITAKGTRWVEGGHPWIYAEEVLREEGACENGALCDAVSEKGKYLGTGFLSRESKIRLRLLSRNANDRFDEAFWRRRIRYAWDYRKSVMAPEDLGCCRVVFGEADGFPGLTVDRFSDILVVQTLSVGMERIKETLFPLLIDELRADGQEIRGIFERNDVAIRALEGMEQYKGWWGGEHPASPVTEICENGVYYTVGKRAENRFFPRPEIQPPRGGAAGEGQAGARLLYPHRLLCAQCREGRRGACDGGGRVRERGGDGAAQRRAQRSGR